MSTIRGYETNDTDAVERIWREIGWADGSERQSAGLRTLISGGDSLVGLVDGEPECFVQAMDGRIRHLDTDLSLVVVNAVTTSHVARRAGLASAATARLVAGAAQRGAEVAVLGMFEQGFYDRLGFGSGGYTTRFTIDPATLRVQPPRRPVVRLGPDAAAEILALNQRAERHHGGVVIDDLADVAADLEWDKSPVSLGVHDRSGRLTGYLLGSTSETRFAQIDSLVGETTDDVLELFGVMKGLSDQWVTVSVLEPPTIQLQDLVDRPIRQRHARHAARQDSFANTIAWWQIRILDLERAVARTRWVGEPLCFQLRLDDPLSARDDLDWSGLAGDWIVALGHESNAERATDPSLPELTSGVAAFSRLWSGVRTATALSRTTDLHGPDGLLAALDDGLWVPTPHPGRFF